nr:zinc finger, CCHC-type [Tanacetum cinerariifolium]
MITPYELWTKKKLNLNYLELWGCRAVVRLPDPKRKTLGKRGIECIFVGYDEHSKAFRFYVTEINESVSINLKLNQRMLYLMRRDSLQSLNQVLGFQLELKALMDVALWKETINDEMDSIMGNNTWVLDDLPLGYKPLGCKWIFKIKLKVDGTIEKFKASKFDETDKGVIIFLYVDDMLIFGTDQVQVNPTKEFLSSRFSIKDMGEADVFLSVRIKHEMLEGYNNASWINNTKDNSSTSGWVFLLGEGAISWASKK